MKELNGSEIAGFIKERQAKAVRGLRQAFGVHPKLAIVVTVENPVIEIYMNLKKKYGQDILVDVDIHRVGMSQVVQKLDDLNEDESVHGVIVQLPLADNDKLDETLNKVSPEKDVDALGIDAVFDPATPTAILWLLAGYGVDYLGKKVALVGRGKLVGAPLEKMLLASDVDVTSYGRSDDLSKVLSEADIIITATGAAGIIKSEMIKNGATVVDAGVAVEEGRSVGDLADDVYLREDLKITPRKGGVGPLTVCALFENVIKAAKIKAGIRLEN